jgi:hypothetical protein
MMIEIPLDRGYVALIDDEDADLLAYKWAANGEKRRYYVTGTMPINGKNKRVRIHRVILERKLGRPLKSNEYCDHIHGNRLDNRRSELRVANAAQNAQNKDRPASNSTGVKGVSVHYRSGEYIARITVNHKEFYLGRFATLEEAKNVYREAAIKYHGEFARFD